MINCICCRKSRLNVGSCGSSCLTSAVVWQPRTSSGVTTSSVKQEVSMMNPRWHQQSSWAEATLESTVCILVIDSIDYSLIVLWLVSHPCIPQPTHSLHSLSTWWSFPTWPFTWQPSGTLGTKRWSLRHHRKTSGTESELWTLEWHHDAVRLRSAMVSEVILEQQVHCF